MRNLFNLYFEVLSDFRLKISSEVFPILKN